MQDPEYVKRVVALHSALDDLVRTGRIEEARKVAEEWQRFRAAREEVSG